MPANSVSKPLIVVGAGESAEMVCEYLRRDTAWDPVAFAVNREFIEAPRLLGLPVVALEDCERSYPPDSHAAIVAAAYGELNRSRLRLYEVCKGKGYTLASYSSPRTYIDPGSSIGENVIIFEDCVIQRGCSLGNNVLMWCGTHICHRTHIEDHVFFASRVAVSGNVRIGARTFLGVNASVGDYVEIGADCTVGAGAVVTRNLPDNSMIKPPKGEIREGASMSFWRVK